MEMWIPILVAILSGLVSYVVSYQRIRHEIELPERRLRRDYQLEFSTESVLRQLLSIATWELRSYDEIKRRLTGLDDNEVRKALIRAGAVCFSGKDGEVWGLVERNRDRLGVD